MKEMSFKSGVNLGHKPKLSVYVVVNVVKHGYSFSCGQTAGIGGLTDTALSQLSSWHYFYDADENNNVVIPLGPSTASVCPSDEAPKTERRMSFFPIVTVSWSNSRFTRF